MFLKGYACFVFLNPQDEVGPSISSSVVLCSIVLLVYIVVLVLVVCLCPFSVRVGSEAWVLKKREEQCLEAAQMKFLGHLLSYTLNP